MDVGEILLRPSFLKLHLVRAIQSLSESVCRYQVAGRFLYSDIPIEQLAPFLIQSETSFESNIISHSTPSSSESHGLTWLAEPAWIANAWRSVGSAVDQQGITISVDGVVEFWVDRSGDDVHCTRVYPEAAPSLVAEVAIGPALILALALSGTWTFHASAVRLEEGVILFLGDSGAGKSTLARYLSEHQPGFADLISDDILPVTVKGSQAFALPHYPQLKIPPDQQPGVRHPADLPLLAIYVLDKSLQTGASVLCQPLQPGQAALALIQHSVAARLFDRELLTRQFAFTSRMAHIVPVHRLAYTHRFEILPSVRTAIMSDLSSPSK